MTTERQRQSAPFTVGDRVCHRSNTDCRGTVTYCEYQSGRTYGSWYVKVHLDGEPVEGRRMDCGSWRDLSEILEWEAKPAIERLEAELSRHDWYCHMSDSYGVTLAGERHYREMVELAKECDSEEARKLWEAAKPDDFPVPTFKEKA